MSDDDPNGRARHAQGSSGQDPEAGLAQHLSELAREMRAEPDMAALLERITVGSVLEVDGADYVGISLIQGKRVETKAATDDLVARIDEQQYRLQQGPCLQALREQMTVRADDFHDEPRWPAFATAVLELGIRSMLSVQLFVDGDNLGALNMYATKPSAFTDHDETVAMLLAAHAAVAMKGSDVESNLRNALESRDVIGQAKGILMERYKIRPLEAFNLLVIVSQRTNRKLRDVADELAASGELKIN